MMKTLLISPKGSLGIHRALVCISILFLVACAPIPTSKSSTAIPLMVEATPICNTPLSSSTAEFSPTPSLEPIPSTATLTDAVLDCPFGDRNSHGKLTDSQYEDWCNSGCPLRQEHIIYYILLIKSSEREDKCDLLYVPLNRMSSGISVRFPTWWVVQPRGPGRNLLFQTDKGQEIFVRRMITDLPLERADEASYTLDPSGPRPLVDPNESWSSKEMQTISDKEVLVLVTTKSDLSIKRYFTIFEGILYVFEIEIPEQNFNDEESTELFVQVEDIITSMQFVR